MNPAAFQALEQKVERHDLCQRGRMAKRIRIRGLQHRPTITIDYNRSGWRQVFLSVSVAAISAFIAVYAIVAAVMLCIGPAACDNDSRRARDDQKIATRPPTGSRAAPHHHAPLSYLPSP